MKAITLYEPWASLMAIGSKTQETRPVRTKHFGDICIHAAQKDTTDISEQTCHAAIRAFADKGFGPMANFGKIVAVVDLYEIVRSEAFRTPNNPHGKIELTAEELAFGNYAPGRFIYLTRNLRRLRSPVPCRGFQCIGWTVPDDVAARVKMQLPITPTA